METVTTVTTVTIQRTTRASCFRTRLKEDDALETRVFRGIDLQRLKLGDDFLKGADFRHERRHAFGGDAAAAAAAGIGRQPGCSQQSRSLERDAELSGSEDEEFAPRLLKEEELVAKRKRDEGGDVLRPLDGHEKNAGGGFADGLGVRIDILQDFVGILDE